MLPSNEKSQGLPSSVTPETVEKRTWVSPHYEALKLQCAKGYGNGSVDTFSAGNG